MSMIGTLPLSKGAARSHGAGRHSQMTGDEAPAVPLPPAEPQREAAASQGMKSNAA